MRHFQRSTLQELMALNIPVGVQKGLDEVIRYYLTHTLEKHLNSPEFISRMKVDLISKHTTE